MNARTSLKGVRRPQSSALVPALAHDMALMFGQIGVHSFHASVVDLNSMEFQSAWSITEHGEFTDDRPDRSLDSVFPGAMATIVQLGQEPAETTVVRKLSPRHWAFAWRLDERHVAVAEARYHDKRDEQSAVDTALLRLVCDTGIRAGRLQSPAASHDDVQFDALEDADGGTRLDWHAADQRHKIQVPSTTRAGVVLTMASAALAVWVAAVALPWARHDASVSRADAARLHSLADTSLSHSLASTLASGDYGEVQAVLSSFGSLGYFQSALVTNARQQVISMSGDISGVRIGDAVPPALAASARVLDLTLGTEPRGQLLLLGAPRQRSQDIGAGVLWVSAALACLTTAAAALMLVVRYRKKRRPPL